MKNGCPSCGGEPPAGTTHCPYCAAPLSESVGDAGRGALADRAHVRSAEIISHLARSCGRSEGEATSAVDGFWEYLSDPDHYTHGEGDRFVVPHFGIFRTTSSFRRIAFLSHHRSNLRPAAAKASSGWIDRLRSTPEKLSVRRRITAAIAGAKKLDLRVAHELVSELFAFLTEIFLRGRARLVWAKRGVMSPVCGRYRLRLYPSFARSLR